MIIIGVYILTDTRTKKFYVGSSQDINKRIRRHIHELMSNKHHNSLLQAVWNENGNLIETYFPTETVEEARILEDHLFEKYKNSKLLITIGRQSAGGDNLTYNPNRLEIIEKIRASCKLKIGSLTKYERELLYSRPGTKNGMWGKTHTSETRLSLSIQMTGNSYAKGSIRSEEHRKSLSDSAKLRIGGKNPFYGKHHSEDTKSRMSELMKSKNIVPANIRKVLIGDKIYDSVTRAASSIGVSPALIVYRLKKTDKYPDYRYFN